MKKPLHHHFYRAMLRRLLIAIMLGMTSAVIVWLGFYAGNPDFSVVRVN